jgi:hypothetical protein
VSVLINRGKHFGTLAPFKHCRLLVRARMRGGRRRRALAPHVTTLRGPLVSYVNIEQGGNDPGIVARHRYPSVLQQVCGNYGVVLSKCPKSL